MSDASFPVIPTFAQQAHMTHKQYVDEYQRSVDHPEAFWADQAKQYLTWDAPWTSVVDSDFATGHARWFDGGKLNVSTNCIDRHLDARGDHIAIIWEGDEPGVSQQVTYRELHEHVGRFANMLKARDVKKGDRVCIYMPMILDAAYVMLACTRIGAIHSVVFGGFSPEALKDRILDADCRVVITADGGYRGGKLVALKDNVDKALTSCPNVHTLLVSRHANNTVAWDKTRDVWAHELSQTVSNHCPAEPQESEDPLFILYTSGSTGKPKGVLHTTAGYLLQASMTHKLVFDYKPGEVYWCTADVGWITGHSYSLYGPLANGATTVMFEGVPTHPTPARFWEICDKHNVASFYTAPTVIRALMGQGDDYVTQNSLKSLRLLGTVGEPINPEAWHWYHNVVGQKNCPIVDTWWQTETGAHMLTPLPGATALKPGSATLPFFGVIPVILDEQGQEINGEGEGSLAIKSSWPSQIRTIYGDHDRFYQTYFSTYKGYYFTGDGARRDSDGYYWITGRVDDVLNVSGHRLGTAEIESALVLHESVAEAAVVGYDHPLKGQGVYAFITLMQGVKESAGIIPELNALCTQEIGPIAKLDAVQWAQGLPKTRSGKIMRRILRKIASNELDTLGDTSTLADPSVVAQLIKNRTATN